jgi:hypothetical protein
MTQTARILVTVSLLLSVGTSIPENHAAQTSGTVSLGIASFSPTTIDSPGRSVLSVSIVTSVAVPSNARATIEVRETANFNGVLYSITPARSITVDLAGGGVSTTARFTFDISPQNRTGGTIVSRVNLLAVFNAGREMPDNIQNLNLTVNPPQSSSCPEFIVCVNGSQWNPFICRCEPTSPIVVDVSGNGFDLTSASSGVSFDFNGDGIPEKTAWTSPNSDDSFLVLDRNNNGVIDNGHELFGNFTPQSRTDEPNGFHALAEFDKRDKGGNQDGRIDSRDSVFEYLRLWRDTNHNGISEPSELSTMLEANISEIDLAYKESRRTDEHGNQFRYRARIKDGRGAQVGRWAWDVFLVPGP